MNVVEPPHLDRLPEHFLGFNWTKRVTLQMKNWIAIFAFAGCLSCAGADLSAQDPVLQESSGAELSGLDTFGFDLGIQPNMDQPSIDQALTDALDPSVGTADTGSSLSPFEECKTCKPQREPTEILWIPTIGLGLWYWRKRRLENRETESGTDSTGNAKPETNLNPYSVGVSMLDFNASQEHSDNTMDDSMGDSSGSDS